MCHEIVSVVQKNIEYILFNSVLAGFMIFRHVICEPPFVLLSWALQTLGGVVSSSKLLKTI